jgi:putative membrane protein
MSAGAHIWSPYCGRAPTPDELLARWNFDPILLLVLAAVAAALWVALRPDHHRRVAVYASFALALFLFISPFCALTSALFSARVVHHVLIAAAMAPLLALSLPRSSLPRVGALYLWTMIQAVAFWAWHWPALYAAALSSVLIYWVMQTTLLLSALGFWVALRRAPPTSAVGALLVTMVQMGLLGALITFAAGPLYAPHLATTSSWGLSSLEDQQLAGLIMWVPAAGIYLAAALAIASRWLRIEARAAA